MLWNFRRGEFANRLPLDCVRTVGELRTVSRLLLGRARKKKIRINLFVVVGVIRLIIVAITIVRDFMLGFLSSRPLLLFPSFSRPSLAFFKQQRAHQVAQRCVSSGIEGGIGGEGKGRGAKGRAGLGQGTGE